MPVLTDTRIGPESARTERSAAYGLPDPAWQKGAQVLGAVGAGAGP
ncbi:hypothetical protein [Nocardia jejuensis]|nr:hypothetical protein [Nocardia jejuensis]